MVAHTDRVALQYSFFEVISATEESPRPLRELRQRCLNPGLYAQHIESWLDYYQSKQVKMLLLIDDISFTFCIQMIFMAMLMYLLFYHLLTTTSNMPKIIPDFIKK